MMKRKPIETWKAIDGYEGLYEVSTWGRVRSLDRLINGNGGTTYLKRGMILTPRVNKFGYLSVLLCINNKGKNFRIHRLVGNTFIPNPDNLPQINHKNENKADNCVWNLEWCTNRYNCNYGNHGTNISESLKNRPDQSKPVLKKDRFTKEILKEYPSVKEASRDTGIADVNISRVCLGYEGHYSAGGFLWEFKE